MQLLTQERNYSCVITSIAMCTGIDIHDLENQVTHNPEKAYEREDRSSLIYRGFQIEDFPYILCQYRWAMIPYFKHAIISGYQMDFKLPEDFVFGRVGLLTFPEESHVVAWDGSKIYDPRGLIYEINSRWSEFWWLKKF